MQKIRKIFTYVLAFLIIIAALYTALKPPEIEKWESHSVEYGETLWGIAKMYNPDGDVNDIITLIRRENGMESSNIYAGDVISVPIMEN